MNLLLFAQCKNGQMFHIYKLCKHQSVLDIDISAKAYLYVMDLCRSIMVVWSKNNELFSMGICKYTHKLGSLWNLICHLYLSAFNGSWSVNATKISLPDRASSKSIIFVSFEPTVTFMHSKSILNANGINLIKNNYSMTFIIILSIIFILSLYTSKTISLHLKRLFFVFRKTNHYFFFLFYSAWHTFSPLFMKRLS